jgi:hypothetical protein
MTLWNASPKFAPRPMSESRSWLAGRISIALALTTQALNVAIGSTVEAWVAT